MYEFSKFSMSGHVGRNDIDFALLHKELIAPVYRPLRTNFAIGHLFWPTLGSHSP